MRKRKQAQPPQADDFDVGAALDDYFDRQCHEELAAELHAFGYDVRSVMKQKVHPVWIVKMQQPREVHQHDRRQVAENVQRATAQMGHPVSRKEVGVMFSGDRIEASFILKAGSPGWLSFRDGQRQCCLGPPIG